MKKTIIAIIIIALIGGFAYWYSKRGYDGSGSAGSYTASASLPSSLGAATLASSNTADSCDQVGAQEVCSTTTVAEYRDTTSSSVYAFQLVEPDSRAAFSSAKDFYTQLTTPQAIQGKSVRALDESIVVWFTDDRLVVYQEYSVRTGLSGDEVRQSVPPTGDNLVFAWLIAEYAPR